MGEDEWLCLPALSGGVDQDARFHKGIVNSTEWRKVFQGSSVNELRPF